MIRLRRIRKGANPLVRINAPLVEWLYARLQP